MNNRLQASVRETAERRAGERRNEFQRAKSLHEGSSRRSGMLVCGLTEEGEAKQTRRIPSLNVAIDRWAVCMGFKHEDRELLKAMPDGEIESRLRKGDIPRTLKTLKTHIIRAVRVQKHIRKGYEAELAETDALLRLLDEANLKLAEIKRRHSDFQITEALDSLNAADAGLSKKQVVVKRLLTRSRIARTSEMLEEAKRMDGAKRDMHVSRACAVFTSARNRLGNWRDRQVAGIAEYNLLKECALRLERDRWLYSQFARFAEIPEKIREWEEADRKKSEVLASIKKALSARKPDWEAVLKQIEENHPLFRVGKRGREKAEEKISLMEAGTTPKEHGKTDYLIGHYAWLYRHVRAKEKRKALEKIEYLELFVKANKPGFILDELSQDPDRYFGPVLEPLSRAVEAYDAGRFGECKAHFLSAKSAIGKYAYARG
ncbi:MAG TPA: hypothetical protein VLD37_03390 [Candidatus Bilamarchaeum sp.]|nr:hypothetical protein [Candidatus Bilamarchaeum sp.]